MPDIDLAAYSVFVPPDPFEDHIGPFYFRLEGDARKAGTVHCVLPTEPRHGNYAGGVHGGAILTFADYALCLVAGRAADGGTNTSFAMTVSIAVEFLDGARIGPPLEATRRAAAGHRPPRLRARQHHPGRQDDRAVVRRVPPRRARQGDGAQGRDRAPPSRGAAADRAGGFRAVRHRQRLLAPHRADLSCKAENDGVTMIQPTLPRMCNSGGVLHGGYMMSFADSAVTRAAALATDMAPTTVSFAAEFLSAGDATAPLTTRVEIPRRGKSLAFLRGLVEQNGRRCSPIRRRSCCGRAADAERTLQPILGSGLRIGSSTPACSADARDLAAEHAVQAPHARQVVGLGGALDRFGDLAQRRGPDHARRALQPVGGAGDRGEVVGAGDLALGHARGVEEFALDLGQGARDRRRTARRACRGRMPGS